MNKTIDIFGEIVGSEAEKLTSDDICLSDIANVISDVEDGDDVVFSINSPGGSVTAGIAIANQIIALNKRGVKTTAVVEGLCASIATVIMCACRDVKIYENSLIMIHNCWSIVQGDANALRKEADIMQKMNDAILSFYRSKFDLTDQQLKDYMDAETWFTGAEAKDFKFDCEVIAEDKQLKMVACLKKYNFKNIPKDLKMEEKIEEEKKEETVVEETEKIEESQSDDTEEKTEEKIEEEKSTEDNEEEKEVDEEKEALKKHCAELEEKIKELEEQIASSKSNISEEECQKRVSGMQAKMQLKINDFTNQLKAKDEELTQATARITSLSDDFEACKKELSDMASAYAAKENALATLNANVNKTPDAYSPKSWRDLEGKEFFDYLKKNNNIIKITK